MSIDKKLSKSNHAQQHHQQHGGHLNRQLLTTNTTMCWPSHRIYVQPYVWLHYVQLNQNITYNYLKDFRFIYLIVLSEWLHTESVHKQALMDMSSFEDDRTTG